MLCHFLFRYVNCIENRVYLKTGKYDEPEITKCHLADRYFESRSPLPFRQKRGSERPAGYLSSIKPVPGVRNTTWYGMNYWDWISFRKKSLRKRSLIISPNRIFTDYLWILAVRIRNPIGSCGRLRWHRMSWRCRNLSLRCINMPTKQAAVCLSAIGTKHPMLNRSDFRLVPLSGGILCRCWKRSWWNKELFVLS